MAGAICSAVMFDGENILSRLPGQYLGAALQTLPNAETATVESMDATIDAPGIGTVRVTAKRMQSKRGKVSHYFWTAEKAFFVEGG